MLLSSSFRLINLMLLSVLKDSKSKIFSADLGCSLNSENTCSSPNFRSIGMLISASPSISIKVSAIIFLSINFKASCLILFIVSFTFFRSSRFFSAIMRVNLSASKLFESHTFLPDECSIVFALRKNLSLYSIPLSSSIL